MQTKILEKSLGTQMEKKSENDNKNWKERKRVELGYLISGYRNEVGGGRRWSWRIHDEWEWISIVWMYVE
jgi:hypothetical protein